MIFHTHIYLSVYIYTCTYVYYVFRHFILTHTHTHMYVHEWYVWYIDVNVATCMTTGRYLIMLTCVYTVPLNVHFAHGRFTTDRTVLFFFCRETENGTFSLMCCLSYLYILYADKMLPIFFITHIQCVAALHDCTK